MMTRRQAVQTGALGLLGATLLPGQTAPAAPSVRRSRRPRGIIFLVTDGMSSGVPALAEMFSRQIRQRGTHWQELLRSPEVVHGWFDMASLNSSVTDSAPAASAWGSGSRVFNRTINFLPDGRELQPIAVTARVAGRRVGLVTTATITHATPAGFAAAVRHRDDEQSIARQYLQRVDVLLGGGRGFFDPALRDDEADLLAEYARDGYAVVQDRDGLRTVGGGPRLLGLFDDSHLPYTVDRLTRPELAARVPTLEEMTRAALAALAPHRAGFLLQVEAARVDHAAHANDPAALLHDQLAFDDALGAVREYVRSNPDTLVVITTDHGNSNPGLNGLGSEYTESDEAFTKVAAFTTSFHRLQDEILRLNRVRGAAATPAEVQKWVRDGTSLDLTVPEAEALLNAARGGPPLLGNQQQQSVVGLLGTFTGNRTGIGWTGTTHTSDWTPLMAFGPGASEFQGLHLNTDNYRILTGLMGVMHSNPSMTPEEARPFQRPAAARADWASAHPVA